MLYSAAGKQLPPEAIEKPKQSTGVLEHLQVLRVIAASLVVVDHTIASVHLGEPPSPQLHTAGLIGSVAVSTFFTISGLIMLRQAGNQFGSFRCAEYFLSRRIIRIVPLYWILTFYRIYAWGLHGVVHPGKQLLVSLFFLPNFSSNHPLHFPLLQNGWTLNYEMFFYLLFAFALLLPRKAGITSLVVLLILLLSAGAFISHHLPPSIAIFLLFYSSGMLTFFVAGILFELLTAWRGWQQRVRFPLSPAYLLVIVAMCILVWPGTYARAGNHLLWLGVLIVFLCILAKPEQQTKLWRALVFLGNASYSTYLVHLFVIWPVMVRLGWMHSSKAYLPVLIVSTVIAANLVGTILHVVVERPLLRVMLRGLKRLPWNQGTKPAPLVPTYLR